MGTRGCLRLTSPTVAGVTAPKRQAAEQPDDGRIHCMWATPSYQGTNVDGGGAMATMARFAETVAPSLETVAPSLRSS
jgi:hypothetical protein